MTSERSEELLGAILDGEATELEIAELNTLAEQDEALAMEVADRISEHRLLGLIHQPFDSELCVDAIMDAIDQEDQATSDQIFSGLPDHQSTTPDYHRRRVLLASIAATIALAFCVYWLAFRSDSEKDSTSPLQAERRSPRGSIATLVLDEKCAWSPTNPLVEGERIGRGPIELKSGTAIFRFDNGAELVMSGPATIEPQSAASVAVHLGDVVVRATDGAEGFVVLTPTSEVIDLGTEFAVKVEAEGNTELHVLDGEVSCRKLGDPDQLAKIVRAGQGLSIHSDSRPVAVPMNSPRFREYVRQLNPRPQSHLLDVYEGFNYSPGFLPLGDSTVGIGWRGPWRKRKPFEMTRPYEDASPDELEIVHGQMNVTWPVPGGRMGMLKLPAGNTYYVRPMEHAIDLGENSITYVSMMVRETERRNKKRGPRERLRLTFRSLDHYYSQYISFGHSGRYQPRVQTGDGALHRSPQILPAEQTTLWIGKIISRKNSEDEIYFRVYGEGDTLGYAEPASWHVVSRGVDFDNRLDCVILSSEGTTERIVDEIRIGPTWRSVAPIITQ